jgi:hypothetical protein
LPSQSAIVERICRDAGISDLLEVLADRLSGSDLQSLLLEVFRARSARRSAAELLAQRVRDETVSPAPVDARRLHEVEGWPCQRRRASTRSRWPRSRRWG